MFSEFARDRLEKASKPLSDIIPRAISHQLILKKKCKQVRVSKGKYSTSCPCKHSLMLTLMAFSNTKFPRGSCIIRSGKTDVWYKVFPS
jgi:hypothetical protein